MSNELIIQNNNEITKSDLYTQIAVAKMFPRNLSQCIDYAIQLATMDEATAQSCFYCLPRKEKDGTRKEIKGASIRLAEIMVMAWGHMELKTRVLSNDGKFIIGEGYARDKQTGNESTKPATVSIMFGKGDKQYQANYDMQTVLTNAACSKALRNAIFTIIPPFIYNRVLEPAMRFSIGDQKTINAKVQEVFDKLVKMGIDKDKILAYYGRANLSEINADDLRSLIGAGTAIKENWIKIEDLFDYEKDGESQLSAAEKISNLIHSKKTLLEEMKNDEKQVT